MRAIDADALIADCQLAQKQADRHGREFANAFYSGGGEVSTEWWCVEDMIENAPTIEPRCEVCEAFNKTRLLIPQPERTGGYKVGVQDQKGSWDRFEAWEKLSQVYQMKGLPDLAYSIIGDVMRFLDVPDAEEPKKCDTCRHEKSQWFNRCADCSDYELWEGKEE